MKKPIRVVKYTVLAKEWDRVAGFIAIWFQQEVGFTNQQFFTREMLFRAEASKSGLFYEITCQGTTGEEVKVVSARLYRALMDYSCIRSWRLPQSADFFIGVQGGPICPRHYKRYEQILDDSCGKK